MTELIAITLDMLYLVSTFVLVIVPTVRIRVKETLGAP